MNGIPESLILLAVAGVVLQFWGRTGAYGAGIRPAGLVVLALAAVLPWIQGIFNLSMLSATTGQESADVFDSIVRQHAVWITCGPGVSLLIIDRARGANNTGLVLLAVAGLGAIAGGDSAIWLIVGLYAVATATALMIRTDDRERSVFQVICLALFLFGMSLLVVQTGTLSLSEMRSTLHATADSAERAALPGGWLSIAASVFVLAGLSGFISSAWLPWGVERPADDDQIGALAARALLPTTTAVLILLRLFPGLLSAWNADVVTIVMITALLLTGVGLLGLWLQTNLREMLGWASVAHAGLWFGSLTVAGWDANHPGWSLVTESGLPGGYTATLMTVFCDVTAMLGVWSLMSLLTGERGSLKHPDELCGLLREHPLAGGTMSVCLLSLCGAPFLAGFWGRWWSLTAMFGPRQESSLTGLYEPHYGFLLLVAVSAAAQLLLCGLYLRLLQRIVLEHPLGRIRSEGNVSVLVCSVVLAGVVVFVGIWPVPLMRAVTPKGLPIPLAPAGPLPIHSDDNAPSAPAGGSGGQQVLHSHGPLRSGGVTESGRFQN